MMSDTQTQLDQDLAESTDAQSIAEPIAAPQTAEDRFELPGIDATNGSDPGESPGAVAADLVPESVAEPAVVETEAVPESAAEQTAEVTAEPAAIETSE